MEIKDKKAFAVPVIAAAMVAGIGIGAIGTYAHSAAAADVTASTTGNTAADAGTERHGSFDPTKGGHVANGITEQVLTGELATKATAAALAAVPGGTVERVENDAEGAAYEAHMTKSDGSHVTVKFDSNFNVTATETGHGGPGH